MKVTELLLEYSDLSYDGDLKRVMGDTHLWLEKAGISQQDVRDAMKQIKKLHEFERMAEATAYVGTAKTEANGSIVFRCGDDWIAHVTAMGQIRFATPSGWRKSTSIWSTFSRLQSPKPALVHGDGVSSLVKTMRQALRALAKKPKMAKALRDHESKHEKVEEAIEPKTQGWYITQMNQSTKESEYIKGPMTEDAANTELDRLGGSKKGFSKAFVSQLALKKAQDAEAKAKQAATTVE